MKWKGLFIVILIFSSVFLGAYLPGEDGKEKEALILNAVVNYLDALHFQPANIDDEFSSRLFDNYIENLDPGKRFLTQTEVDQLSIHKTAIDDHLRMRISPFFETSYEVINTALDRAEMIFLDAMDSEFDIESREYIEMDADKRTFASDQAELKEIWKEILHFDIVMRMEDKIQAQEAVLELNEGEENLPEIKTREELKQEAIDETRKSYTELFERLEKNRRADYFELYVNAITHLFDPHSDYLSPKAKEDFDIRLGGKLEGIGARLQTDGDFTKVVSIIPGGPAWKGKELEVNDIITAVTQEGEEPLSIKGMRIDDVVQLIRGDKGTIVILKVRKPDGRSTDIEIVRDEVIIDESFARSLQLDLSGVINNVGYIKLPTFYSSFEGKDGNSSAIDVAAEIEKLKDENVNAIILDLRNNGGGSLNDVVDMTGLFIEDGPIVQVKPRTKGAYVYEDEDKSVRYSGPLVVMVNQFSASASEILAAALQDYNRAIIVGSNSTFGKGTVQRFIDLDKAYRDQQDKKPLGQLKITMQKFYRINGGSTQLKGVIPDIILPNNYHFLDTGEKDFDNPMEWSEIEPVEFSQTIYTVDNREMIQNRSQERIDENEDFQLIMENAARLKKNSEMTSYPLSLEAYKAFVDHRKAEAEKYESVFDDEVEGLKINNLAVDTSYINADESRVARNEDWIQTVQKDLYLEETLHVLKDMIDLNEKEKDLGLHEKPEFKEKK